MTAECIETMEAASPTVLTPAEIMERYLVYARALGRERDTGSPSDSDAHPVYKTAAFSLEWFFRLHDRAARLNTIALAFLGDEGARSALSFGEAAEESFGDALLEGRFPLNARQRRAIARALESSVSIVQGPPGTGKTETILNMVSCMIARGATVAVVANNGKAIDNITEKVRGWAQDSAAGPNQRRLAQSYARLGGKLNRRQWLGEHADVDEELAFFVKEAKASAEGCYRYGSSGWEPKVRAEAFLARWPFITSTIHSLQKCFSNGEFYQYDYVIMDEASQCNPMLGLVAMSSAKHLVLVGDVEQLPPIYSNDADRDLRREVAMSNLTLIERAPYALKDEASDDGASIIAAADGVFEQLGASKTFLNEHYRCHPGIIAFCNECIYKPSGEELAIRTPEYDRSVQVPIRVRWFEGNYCERYLVKRIKKDGSIEDPLAAFELADSIDKEEGSEARTQRSPRRFTRANARQLDIFMREEWPLLKERRAADPNVSACVLSPYRGELNALEILLRRDPSFDPQFAGQGMAGDVAGEPPADIMQAPQVPMFTIHRSQGQEFDIVYLLPGEDGSWEWPWTEAKSLINVAVSRAKRELVVIASTCLMDEDMQRELVGEDRVVPARASKEGVLTPEEREAREERERFIRRLMEYVRDHNDPQRTLGAPLGFPESSYAFGFKRAALRSVFDILPRERMRRAGGAYAPERALEGALEQVDLAGRGLVAVHDAALSSCIDPSRLDVPEPMGKRMKAFIDKDSHFDFAIFDQTTRRLVLAIEVDGEQHRVPTGKAEGREYEGAMHALLHRRENDALKDRIVQALGGRVLATNRRADAPEGIGAPTFTLLRLPTDGTTAFEIEGLRRGLDGDRADIAREFLTIEELVDDQLGWGFGFAPRLSERCASMSSAHPAAKTGGFGTVGNADAAQRLPTLSALIRRWAKEDAADAAAFARLTTRQANLLLEQAGYLEKDKDGAWCLTALGKRVGMRQEAEQVEERRKGVATTKIANVIRYTEGAAAAVRRVLSERAL